MAKPEIMKIGILSSSRADYGVYLPLLRKLQKDPFFLTEIIAFGTHLLEKFGRTVEFIHQDGYKVIEVRDTMSQGDSPAHIARAMSKTMLAFSKFFSKSD